MGTSKAKVARFPSHVPGDAPALVADRHRKYRGAAGNQRQTSTALPAKYGWAWLKHIRETDGLDRSEAEAMVNRIGVYADNYDDHLSGKRRSSRVQEAAAPGAPAKNG
ncbi:MAG: hypothetical protein U0176_12835 [Bacteroidia bacterium]